MFMEPGPGHLGHMERVGVFLAQKLAKQPYTVVGDGTQTRDFTYVSDVADAVFAAVNANPKNNKYWLR